MALHGVEEINPPSSQVFGFICIWGYHTESEAAVSIVEEGGLLEAKALSINLLGSLRKPTFHAPICWDPQHLLLRI